jgi:diguanylate cyclase (GGDEF)-like protein/PAS domain S-box-containing protein
MTITRLVGIPAAGRSLVLLASAAVLTALYMVAPDSMWAESIRIVAPIIAIGAVLSGVATYRPGRMLPWALISVAFVALTAAHSVWAILDTRQSVPFPAVPDGFHVVFWLALLAGIVVLTRLAAPDSDPFGGFEVAIISIAVGVGVWLIVVEPLIARSQAEIETIVWAGVVPIVGGLAFAATVRHAANGAFREYAALAMMAGTSVQLMSDVIRTTAEINGEFASGSFAAALGIAGSLVFASGALDPSMAPSHRGDVTNAELGIARTIGLSVAVLTPLTVLLALAISGLGSTATLIVVSLASLVSVVFALARMWGLLDSVQALTERRGQDRLAAMVEHSSDVVVMVDETGDIKYASPGLTVSLGHRTADWIGRPLIDLIAQEDREAARTEFERLFDLGPDGTIRIESNLVRVDGQRRRMEATFANLIGGDAVDGIVVTFRDVTEQRDLERRLNHRAFHDELTGLANRALFLDRMDHALLVARPDADPVVVLFVDLDDFKAVNDALGHGVGDQLLRTIAERVRAVAGSGDTPARLGGDEFALLLEDRGGIDRALDVAERLLDELREPVRLGGYDLAVLASVGVAVAAPGMTTSSLLRDADIAMYEAKRAGKGRIKIFDPAMRLGASTQLEYRSELGAALDNSQLRLVYQPMIDLRTGEVTGAEALVRWRHPTRGEVPPSEFIPVAERSGLIKDIGSWVLQQAMSEAARWQARGRRLLTINVSVVQLRSADFVDLVRDALTMTGLDPTCLLLEINESVLVEQVDVAHVTLSDLHALGVLIGIDDFGSGYGSLAHLHTFPIDVVKIDRQHVDVIGTADEHASLARMILYMTAGLDVTSVAEGIERPEQIAALRRLGCDIGQGHLLSAPLELDVVRQRFGVGNESGTHLVGTQ